MKNIQIIDGADNCVYDIFAATEEEFELIFPTGQDVAFIDEVLSRGPADALETAFSRIWQRRLRKHDAVGIHGLLFYDLDHKKQYYPARVDEGAENPDGGKLRGHALTEQWRRRGDTQAPGLSPIPPRGSSLSLKSRGETGATSFDALPLHDAVLRSVEVDWEKKRCVLHVSAFMASHRTSTAHALSFEGVRLLSIPHNEPWGPSSCVNSVSASDGDFRIEMQSGDVIELSAATFTFSAL